MFFLFLSHMCSKKQSFLWIEKEELVEERLVQNGHNSKLYFVRDMKHTKKRIVTILYLILCMQHLLLPFEMFKIVQLYTRALSCIMATSKISFPVEKAQQKRFGYEYGLLCAAQNFLIKVVMKGFFKNKNKLFWYPHSVQIVLILQNKFFSIETNLWQSRYKFKHRLKLFQ